MSEHRDYLWDRDGEADPTLLQLEKMLGTLAHDGRELALSELPAQVGGTTRRAWPWLVTAAAALVAALVTAAVFLFWPTPPLRLGDPTRTFVASTERLVVKLGELAEITLEPDSELRFEHWRADQALFRLERGTIVARVAPPPAVAPDFFLVDTAHGRITDKGCRYELSIQADGSHVVAVTEGAVTFTFPQRTVYVPSGAGTKVTSNGPSTPLFADCSGELRRAVQRFDEMTQKREGPIREKGIFAVTQACTEPRDSLVLWHLLFDDEPLMREQAESALVDLVGPPYGELSKQQHWEPAIWLSFLRLGAWMQAR